MPEKKQESHQKSDVDSELKIQVENGHISSVYKIDYTKSNKITLLPSTEVSVEKEDTEKTKKELLKTETAVVDSEDNNNSAAELGGSDKTTTKVTGREADNGPSTEVRVKQDDNGQAAEEPDKLSEVYDVSDKGSCEMKEIDSNLAQDSATNTSNLSMQSFSF